LAPELGPDDPGSVAGDVVAVTKPNVKISIEDDKNKWLKDCVSLSWASQHRAAAAFLDKVERECFAALLCDNGAEIFLLATEEGE
jgi:hypothetical protein